MDKDDYQKGVRMPIKCKLGLHRYTVYSAAQIHFPQEVNFSMMGQFKRCIDCNLIVWRPVHNR